MLASLGFTTTSKAELVETIGCSLEQITQLSDYQKPNTTLVAFDYTNENLINIINRLAAHQGINILFPTDDSKIDIKVSLNLSQKIPLTQAWNLVNNFLEIAGYALVPKGSTYEIVSNKDVNKEPLPTYINIHPEKLPEDDSKIRYLYYLQNINLNGANNKSKANLELILKDMLAGNSVNNFVLDAKSNCIIISNKASNIKAVMQIVMSLDREGFREAIEIVPLKHTNAKNITGLINNIIQNKKDAGQYRYNAPAGNDEDLYFSKNTSVVPIERNNSIAIMGRIDAVDKVKDFIIKYLDVKNENGKSIVHIKELQHLDATDLKNVLQKIVRAKIEGAQSSSQADALSEVIITAEQDEKIDQIKQLEIKKAGTPPSKIIPTNNAIAGNNCLIIAAREPEWLMLEKLIDEIDLPQEQVAIEALIVDLTVIDDANLSAQTRNFNGLGTPKSVNFQSDQIGLPDSTTGSPVMNYIQTGTGSYSPYPTSQGLASDLLTAGALSTTSGTTTLVNQLVDIVNKNQKGATLISFSDGNTIASLLEIFSGYQNAKILSQPFVTTHNHQQAAMSSSNERLVVGAVEEQSVGGPAIIKQDIIKADLKFDILPRISKSGMINLEVIVHVSDFVNESASSNNNTIFRRKIQTNANLTDKQVLVIGGLTKLTTVDTFSGMPIISKIPILGNLFKSRSKITTKSTLMVFLSPKIIKPRKGISKFTQNKLNEALQTIKTDELSFDSLGDPITRIMFPGTANRNNLIITDFAEQGMFEKPLDPAQNKGPISGKIT